MNKGWEHWLWLAAEDVSFNIVGNLKDNCSKNSSYTFFYLVKARWMYINQNVWILQLSTSFIGKAAFGRAPSSSTSCKVVLTSGSRSAMYHVPLSLAKVKIEIHPRPLITGAPSFLLLALERHFQSRLKNRSSTRRKKIWSKKKKRANQKRYSTCWILTLKCQQLPSSVHKKCYKINFKKFIKINHCCTFLIYFLL